MKNMDLKKELFPMRNAMAVDHKPELYLVMQNDMSPTDYMYGEVRKTQKQAEQEKAMRILQKQDEIKEAKKA